MVIYKPYLKLNTLLHSSNKINVDLAFYDLEFLPTVYDIIDVNKAVSIFPLNKKKIPGLIKPIRGEK